MHTIYIFLGPQASNVVFPSCSMHSLPQISQFPLWWYWQSCRSHAIDGGSSQGPIPILECKSWYGPFLYMCSWYGHRTGQNFRHWRLEEFHWSSEHSRLFWTSLCATQRYLTSTSSREGCDKLAVAGAGWCHLWPFTEDAAGLHGWSSWKVSVGSLQHCSCVYTRSWCVFM